MKPTAKLFTAAGVALGLCFAAPSFATPASDALSQCMAHSATEDDNTVLVRWIFIVMSKHSKVTDLSAVTPQLEDQTNRKIGALFERLMTEDCPTETAAAMSENGDDAMGDAFGALFTKAFSGLEDDPAVTDASRAFIKYVDMNKLVQVMIAPPKKGKGQ